ELPTSPHESDYHSLVESANTYYWHSRGESARRDIVERVTTHSFFTQPTLLHNRLMRRLVSGLIFLEPHKEAMKLYSIALAGALSLTLALAGCSNGEEPTPEPDATSSEAPEVELDLPEQSEEELNEQLAPDTEAEVDSGLNPDAHPLCAALIDFEEIGGGD